VAFSFLLTSTYGCGDLLYAYTVTYSDGTALPSFITIGTNTGVLNVYTTDNTYAATYKLLVKAVANDGSYKTVSFNLIVNAACYG
jgi:hypothetical protein